MLGEDKVNKARTYYETVDNIMLKTPVALKASKTTYDAMAMMREKRVDTVFVVDEENHLLGLVDMFDLQKYGKNIKTLEQVKKHAYAIEQDTIVMSAIEDIHDLEIKNLPVVDYDNHLVGLITRATVAETIYSNLWGSDDKNEEEDEDDSFKDDNLVELINEASGDSNKKIEDKSNLTKSGDKND